MKTRDLIPTPLLVGLTLLTAAGCNTFSVKTPKQFVSLERARTRTYYKAVSPENAVITVSSFKHKDKGNLEFWAAILSKEMTLQRGYKLTKVGPVRTDAGLEGRRLAFQAKNGSTPYRYEATLFVTSKHIYVVEAAAKAKLWKRHRSAIDALVGSFRPR